MRKALLQIIGMFFASNSFAQVPTFQWAGQLGELSSQLGNSIATDKQGNSYITGNFQSTADFDPGVDTFLLTSNGNQDVFFAKYDSNGALIFAKNIGGTGEELGVSISVDTSGDICLMGNFSATMDFDPGIGTEIRTPLSSSRDVFIAKYDNGGNFIWVKQITRNGTSTTLCNSMTTDYENNFLITGDLYGVLYFQSDTGYVSLFGSLNPPDIYIAKYDASGQYLWSMAIGASASVDRGITIGADSLNNIYASGQFGNTVDFDPGVGVQNLTCTSGNSDIFIAKYNPNGMYLWAKRIAGANSSAFPFVKDMAIQRNGNIYITGGVTGTADFNPPTLAYLSGTSGSQDIFIAKYDFNGNYLWAKKTGGVIGDYGNSIVVDSVGNAFFAGYYYGTVDFDPSAAVFNLYTYGHFFAKYTSSGSLAWAKNIVHNNHIDIAIDMSNNVYMTGYFDGTVDFDAGPAVVNLITDSNPDVYIAKYGVSIATNTNEIVEEMDVNIYPNPFTLQTTVFFNKEQTNATMKIVDVLGKEIKNINFTGRQLVLEKGEMLCGIYFIQIIAEGQIIANKKIIVQ